jgi:hypothetical protein
MTDDLLAFLDAALSEPVSVHEHHVAGFMLEVVCDDYGILAATWRCGAWWRVAEVGGA